MLFFTFYINREIAFLLDLLQKQFDLRQNYLYLFYIVMVAVFSLFRSCLSAEILYYSLALHYSFEVGIAHTASHK